VNDESDLKPLLCSEVRYKLTGAEFSLEFSAKKAATRQELGLILAELADGLQAEYLPHAPDMF
jgi:hypothetical protein